MVPFLVLRLVATFKLVYYKGLKVGEDLEQPRSISHSGFGSAMDRDLNVSPSVLDLELVPKLVHSPACLWR